METWRPIFFLFVAILGLIANILATVNTATCEETEEENYLHGNNSCYYADRAYQLVLATILALLSMVIITFGFHLNKERGKRQTIIKSAIVRLSSDAVPPPSNIDPKIRTTRIHQRLPMAKLQKKIHLWQLYSRIAAVFPCTSIIPSTRLSTTTLASTVGQSTLTINDEGNNGQRRSVAFESAVQRAKQNPLKNSASAPALVVNSNTSCDMEQFCETLREDMKVLYARKVSGHQTRIGYVLALATVVGYCYKFLLVLMFHECANAMHYASNQVERISDASYFFSCTIFYMAVCYWIHTLNRVPLSDSRSYGAGIICDLVIAISVLLFIKVNADEGLEVHHQLLEAEARRSLFHATAPNITHVSTTDALSTLVPQSNYSFFESDKCTDGKKMYLAVIDKQFISAMIYLFKAEAIPVLIILLHAVRSTNVHPEEQIGIEVAHNTVGRTMHMLITVEAVLASLACLANLYTLFDYISGPSNNMDQYGTYSLSSCIRGALQLLLLATLGYYVKVDKKAQHDPMLKAHRQHAQLDVRLLFVALGPIYVLVTAAVISLGIEWQLVPRQDINACSLVDDILIGVVYTAQYLCFKRLMHCTHADLLQQRDVILPGVVGVMLCNFMGWFATFAERMFIDRVFVPSQFFYSEPIWAAIVASAFPGLVFINFHTAVCCIVLIQKKQQIHRTRRGHLEKMLTNRPISTLSFNTMESET